MNPYDDAFTVYLRLDPAHVDAPEDAELSLGTYASYEDARRAQKVQQRQAHQCMIRFQGDSGGGD